MQSFKLSPEVCKQSLHLLCENVLSHDVQEAGWCQAGLHSQLVGDVAASARMRRQLHTTDGIITAAKHVRYCYSASNTRRHMHKQQHSNGRSLRLRVQHLPPALKVAHEQVWLVQREDQPVGLPLLMHLEVRGEGS